MSKRVKKTNLCPGSGYMMDGAINIEAKDSRGVGGVGVYFCGDSLRTLLDMT